MRRISIALLRLVKNKHHINKVTLNNYKNNYKNNQSQENVFYNKIYKENYKTVTNSIIQQKGK
jgi:hypothetical protein